MLGRRRARIVSEEMREGADVFAVHAFLPAEASFGLMTEMRQRSSGGAAASLLLSHWERLQVCSHPGLHRHTGSDDPGFEPTSVT